MKRVWTSQDFQRLTLSSQGLTQTSQFGAGKNAVLRTLEHLGYLQIDTLSIVERAHHHTLWTRVKDYKTHYLEELMAERKVFEYWFHAASYIPMKDFRYVLPQMLNIKRTDTHYYNADPRIMKYVLDTIRAEGPKRARDFENETKKQGSWWSWKPTKVALERLFMQGDLMISERNGMQKIYDLTERVLPKSVDLTVPTPIEFAEYLVKTFLRAYGIITFKQITYLRTGEILRKNVRDVLQSLVREKIIHQIEVDGFPLMYAYNDLSENNFKKPQANIQILSPFDNSIIHRERIKDFFNFDFRLECYLPKERRLYGYFCLPLLFGDIFIGRLDCKAHRNIKKLEIIHLHIENTNIDVELWLDQFVKSIKDFAIFNGCESMILTKVSPLEFEYTLKKTLFY
ncbi:winged helix-turn-helix domain-containing protein [Sphingobacterium sp. SG20118]|uniref:winged helix-turn-helix domain-containing protein n=1 Tax=Sphingobacterium sp. SG20118 TaxID=3367156 RepID=UPI0037DFC06F